MCDLTRDLPDSFEGGHSNVWRGVGEIVEDAEVSDGDEPGF